MSETSNDAITTVKFARTKKAFRSWKENRAVKVQKKLVKIMTKNQPQVLKSNHSILFSLKVKVHHSQRNKKRFRNVSK